MNVSIASSHQAPSFMANQTRSGSAQNDRTERNSITRPQSKVLERLREQKQNLIERRADYLSHAVKRGTSAENIKADLEEMNKQIQQMDEAIQKQTLEERRKALGTDEKSKKEIEKGLTEKAEKYNPKTAEEQKQSLITYTMKGVVSANNELKVAKATKMAQITLLREAKGWENTNPVKSAALREKAERLNNKILDIAGAVNKHITEAVQKEQPMIRKDNQNDEKEQRVEAVGVWTEQELHAYSDSSKGKTEAVGTTVNTVA
ncbi:muscle M-line assembly protein unc-89 Uncoordinated protein 89 [Paenibacillus sp. NPDC055715]